MPFYSQKQQKVRIWDCETHCLSCLSLTSQRVISILSFLSLFLNDMTEHGNDNHTYQEAAQQGPEDWGPPEWWAYSTTKGFVPHLPQRCVGVMHSARGRITRPMIAIKMGSYPHTIHLFGALTHSCIAVNSKQEPCQQPWHTNISRAILDMLKRLEMTPTAWCPQAVGKVHAPAMAGTLIPVLQLPIQTRYLWHVPP